MYIPLPGKLARSQLFSFLLKNQNHNLSGDDLELLTNRAEGLPILVNSGFSGADVTNLCKEAALGPIRDITDIFHISASEVAFHKKNLGTSY